MVLTATEKMRKFCFALVVISFFLTIVAETASANEGYPWLNNQCLHVSVQTEDTVYEWEYENPDMFEYEAGPLIFRGAEAERSFDQILKALDLSQTSLTSSMVEEVESLMGVQVRRITVKQLGMNGERKTWNWSDN